MRNRVLCPHGVRYKNRPGRRAEEVHLWTPKREVIQKLDRLTATRSRGRSPMRLQSPLTDSDGFISKKDHTAEKKSCQKTLDALTKDIKQIQADIAHSIDVVGVSGATPTLLATYSYDAIGRLLNKRLGTDPQNGTASTVQSGAWTNPATWQGGIIPGPGSSVSINTGHLVSIPANQTVSAAKLYQAGSLTFLTGSVLRFTGQSSGNLLPQTIDYAWHIRGGLRGLNLNRAAILTLAITRSLPLN